MFKSVINLFISAIFTFTLSISFAANVGDTVPSFKANSLDGSKTVDINDLAGKVVFVDFWASWCTPCLKSLPEFEKLQTSFASRDDVIVLAINLDEDPESANKFLEKINVSYEILADNTGEIPAAFGVSAMPSSYIIDKSGVIQYVHKGYKSGDVDKIKSKIEQLL
jgi:peroxiredoxin